MFCDYFAVVALHICLYFLLNRVWNSTAANVNPTINPTQIPAAPISNGNAHTNPTLNPTMMYDTKAITIGTFTSVIPRSIAAPTACNPSEYWYSPANISSCDAMAITSASSVNSSGI